MKRFIVVQLGARRNYNVPGIFSKGGLLEAFYTDLCADVGLGSIVSRLFPTFLRRGLINNLLSRKLPKCLRGITYSSTIPSLKYFLRKWLAHEDTERSVKVMNLFNIEFGNDLIRHGIGNASHIYAMSGEGTPFIRFAKKRGLTVVTEFYSLLSAYFIEEAERRRFPGVEPNLSTKQVEEIFEWLAEVCSLSDWVIVPSEAVRRDMVENFNFPMNRCFIVPYGIASTWFDIKNNPIRGTILFVGNACFCKGIHIVGMAASNLKNRNYIFRVAGNVSQNIRNHNLTKNLKFLRYLSGTGIQREFSQADIFVLPSLAEGSAMVTYEALAVGLPVITTQAAGSVVRDGIEGFIVPEGNAEILAARIEELIENRQLRDRMSFAAKERAKEYTLEKYGERLLSVIKLL